MTENWLWEDLPEVTAKMTNSQLHGEVQMLHLSDLHVGGDFQETRWSELLNLLGSTINPKIVIASGDLVNSPTRGQFAQAKKRIEEVQGRCPDAHVIVLPGNHDRRIFGICTVSRARWVTLLIFVIARVSIGLRVLVEDSSSALQD